MEAKSIYFSCLSLCGGRFPSLLLRLEEIVFGGSAEDYCSENERAAKDRQGAQILTGIACAFRAIFASDDEPIVIATNDDNDWKFECMMLGYGC